ncbi:hypothetical protein MPSEU_000608000 [Mayamaea pseudoterrestris]|nr:hypothetical protein MPSEU_000608000 [Mayamaea pseudoterrestris]
MRMKKSLSNALASYYENTQPKRLINDLKLETVTEYVKTTRTNDDEDARDGRKGNVCRLLMTESKDSAFAKNVIHDINNEGSPEEMEVVLIKEQGEGRIAKGSSKTNKRTANDAATTPREKRDDAFCARTHAMESSRQRPTAVPHVNSALKKYRNLDALAKSVSWNEDTLQELDVQKSKSGLGKSVSWREELADSSFYENEMSWDIEEQTLSSAPRVEILSMPSALQIERKHSVSDVLSVLRTMRAMSLADSFSLAEDERNMMLATPAKKPALMVTSQKQSGCVMPTVGQQQSKRRKGLFRTVRNGFRGRKTVVSPVHQEHAQMDKVKEGTYYYTGGHPGSTDKSNVIMPREGLADDYNDFSEELDPEIDGRRMAAEAQICGPPSMNSCDMTEQERDPPPSPYKHMGTKSSFVQSQNFTRMTSAGPITAAPVGSAVRPLETNSRKRQSHRQEASMFHHDIQDFQQSIDFCSGDRCACGNRLNAVPTDDEFEAHDDDGREYSLGQASGSDAITMSDSSSDILASSTAGTDDTASGSSGAGIYNKPKSFIDVDYHAMENETLSALLLSGISSAFSESDVASVPSRGITTNDWLW